MKVVLNYYHGAEESIYINMESKHSLVNIDNKIIGNSKLIGREIILNPGESKIVKFNVVLYENLDLLSKNNLISLKVFNLKYFEYQDVVSLLNDEAEKGKYEFKDESSEWFRFKYLDWW